MQQPLITRATPAAWTVWAVGVVTYGVAIMQRTSLGVVGIQASEHFGTTVGIISTFVVVQLATYAVMQIPVGLMLDRFGSRAVMTAGGLIMGLGQVVMATTDLLPVAIGARILLGMGDACIFSSIVRLLPFWFPSRQVPVLIQFSGVMGQLGQIAAVGALLPLTLHSGWQTAFLFAAACAFAIAVVCVLTVRDTPKGSPRVRSAEPLREVPRSLTAVVRHPATTLGFWIHFTAGFPNIVFVMMWGIPFLKIVQGLDDAQASGLFVLVSVLAAAFSPTIGWLTGRHPLRRSNLALIVIGSNLACWVAVLLWPGPAPMWLLVLLIAALAASGPGGVIGLDLARTNLPLHRLGTASGVVNAGSFTGSTIGILLVGIVVDALSRGGTYTAEELRLAMAAQLPLFAVGLAGILISRRALRRRMAADGVVVPSWREVVKRYRRN